MMAAPRVLFDAEVMSNVGAGWVLGLLGAGLLLVAAVWWSWQADTAQTNPKPFAWRVLCGMGWVFFIAGIIWQLVGYFRIGAVTWLQQ